MSTATSIEFENLVLSELKQAWSVNVSHFKWQGSGILPPNFRLSEAEVSHMGLWNTHTREMFFSRSFITHHPWNEVLEVLKHEMVHQYVSEVLQVFGEPPHGKTFYAVCKNNHIDAAPRGLPGANNISTTNHIVEKIRHLLALAQSSNEHEAKLAAETAHNMMLKYNIELQEKNEAKGYTVAFLGGTTGRIQAYMSELSNILSKYYFVEIIWVNVCDPRSNKRGHELEVSGTRDNVEVAEFVYDFLIRSVKEAWEKKMDDPTFKYQMTQEYAKSFGYSGRAPQSLHGFTISARSNFMLGFMQGFASQLKQAEVKEQQAGLVLARDIELEKFYRQRHPHIRSKMNKGGYRNSNMQKQGYVEGQSLKVPPATNTGKKFVPLLGS